MAIAMMRFNLSPLLLPAFVSLWLLQFERHRSTENRNMTNRMDQVIDWIGRR
jgi:hypothetical protein